MLLYLLTAVFVDGQLVDDSLCTVRNSALKFTPSETPNAADAWQLLTPTSRYMTISDLMFSNNISALRLAGSPTPTQPFAAIEYQLPVHTGATGTDSLWAYDLNYTFLQSSGAVNVTQYGLGPWHAIGLDWGARGSAPNMTAIRASSGSSNQILTQGDTTRVLTSVLRLQDTANECLEFANSSSCAFMTWASKTTPDVMGELRVAKYRFIFDGRAMYPSRVQTDFGQLAHDARFEVAAVQAPTNWRPPSRIVIVASVASIFLLQLKLSRLELICPDVTTRTISSQSSPSITTLQSTTRTTGVINEQSNTILSQPPASQSTLSSSSTTTPQTVADTITSPSKTLATEPTERKPPITTAPPTVAVTTFALGTIDTTPPVTTRWMSITNAEWFPSTPVLIGLVVGFLTSLLCHGLFFLLRKTKFWENLYNQSCSNACNPHAPLRWCCGPVKALDRNLENATGEVAHQNVNSMYGPIVMLTVETKQESVYDKVPTITSQYGPAPVAPLTMMRETIYDQPTEPLSE